jgi:formamidopyrimidine-DNA glycosylase
MPELPEVEAVRQSLIGHIVGQRINAFVVGDYPAVLGSERAEDIAVRITGHLVQGVRRRAKYLIIDLDDGTALVIHLRMTGRLSVVPQGDEPLRYQRLAIAFENGFDLRFSDQRKFGRLSHLLPEDLHKLEQRLGLEPLTRDFSAAWLEERLKRRKGKIKAVLLDQQLIGGLGNIYADEALFQAGIHPERPANTLTGDEVRRLHRAIRSVLRNAVEGRGTTFSSFEDADGNRGRYGGKLAVYGRGGKGRCPRCGTLLERTVVGGRGTSFCPHCQPLEPLQTGDDEGLTADANAPAVTRGV